jgi:predicted DNA-binding transcriptional regulator YafY
MRLFRLFRLLDLMRLRSTPVTAASLAEELGVSVRSIYRDISDLQAMGAPIRGEGGIGYVHGARLFPSVTAARGR